MSLPIIFISVAAIASAAGLGSTVRAGFNHARAKNINANSEERAAATVENLEKLRRQCGGSLENLGREKMFVLTSTMKSFLDTFGQIKNVDFTESADLAELNKFHVERASFEEIRELGHFVNSLTAGAVAGMTGGALAAFGAYSAATSLAAASTGTAISALSGAAATNATLAFFGGGSLAAGGLGMAGGMVVLGGLVAGPALLVMGLLAGANAGKGLEQAKASAAETDKICEQLEASAAQCIAIRRKTYTFHNLLARLDAYFLPLIHRMETVVADEGTDYFAYSAEGKKIIAMAVSAALSVKTVLDTPILTEDGSLTEEAETLAGRLQLQLEECAAG